MIKTLLELKEEIKKKKYHIVPPCPICSSNLTGYYRRNLQLKIDEQKEIFNALNNGEFIKIVTDFYDNNCFCLECNTEWYAPIKEVRISEEQLKEYKEQKGITSELLREYFAEMDSTKIKKKNKILTFIFSHIKKSINKKIENNFFTVHNKHFENLMEKNEISKNDRNE